MTPKVPKMKKLTTEQRNKLPKSAFGDPAQRKYPIRVSSLPGFDTGQDLAYARAAKSRAGQQESMGNLSTTKESSVKSKARKMQKRRGRPMTEQDYDDAMRTM